MKSLTELSFLAGSRCGSMALYQGVWLVLLRDDAGRVVGFFVFLLQGISTSFVLPNASLVPWFSFVSIEGSAERLGLRELDPQLGTGSLGNPRLWLSSETDA